MRLHTIYAHTEISLYQVIMYGTCIIILFSSIYTRLELMYLLHLILTRYLVMLNKKLNHFPCGFGWGGLIVCHYVKWTVAALEACRKASLSGLYQSECKLILYLPTMYLLKVKNHCQIVSKEQKPEILNWPYITCSTI